MSLGPSMGKCTLMVGFGLTYDLVKKRPRPRSFNAIQSIIKEERTEIRRLGSWDPTELNSCPRDLVVLEYGNQFPKFEVGILHM